MNEDWFNHSVDDLVKRKPPLGTRELVAEWCRLLGLDSSLVTGALSLRSQLLDIAYAAYNCAHGQQAPGWFGKGHKIDRRAFKDALGERYSGMETRHIVVIAFFLAAGGYVLNRLYRRSAPPELPPEPPPEPPPTPTQQRATLVLVLNAARTEVLGQLRIEGRVPPGIANELYRATQALWMGGENEFASSQLRAWFSPDKATAAPSEYDVHLVRVFINTRDDGFLPGANQMDRIDAFARLAVASPCVEVSPRVPSEAYGTTGVYSR